MRIRRIAILIDGGFFVKRLPKMRGWNKADLSPRNIADAARIISKRHVQRLIGEADDVKDSSQHHVQNSIVEADGEKKSRWLDHTYRLFYYDAEPYNGIVHNPITNRQIRFGETEIAHFRRDLFKELRKTRKFALRLGDVVKDGEWTINSQLTKKLLKVRNFIPHLEAVSRGAPPPQLTEPQTEELSRLLEVLRRLDEKSIAFGLRQKGVDMRIGLDIASLTLKKQVDTIILITGDSDFVSAAKLARREGVEFLLDPMWQSIRDDLNEHIDGLVSVFYEAPQTPPQERPA